MKRNIKCLERHLAACLRQNWLKTPVFASVLISILIFSGCGTTHQKSGAEHKPPMSRDGNNANNAKSGGYYLDDGPGANPPPNLEAIPDAIPKNEPLHRGANRPYVVFGKTYVPNVAADAFKQQGVASWYGRKFTAKKPLLAKPTICMR